MKGAACLAAAFLASAGTAAKPNIVVILCDDLGYGDLSCYGQQSYQTPNIDKLAQDGVRFTDFYAVSPACSPSRASLLTGCYPVRVGVPQVLNPDSPTGLALEETTMAESLKEAGYRTAAIGKWHLGVNNLSPRHHGFDEFFGLPYSNDMWPPNPNGKWPDLWLEDNEQKAGQVTTLTDQGRLTQAYTDRAIKFISSSQRSPFLLYLAHSMPHVPIAASPAFLGKTGKGLYADCITEIDSSTGQILHALKRQGLDKNTIVVFTSDNGPWLPYGAHAGSSGGFREGKGTSFEGGVRVPGIFRWPGKFKAGLVSDQPVTMMDIFPTVARAAEAPLPKAKIDGKDLTPLLTGETTAHSPHPWIYFYWPGELQAVRSGDWKLHLPHSHRRQKGEPGQDGRPSGEATEKIGLSLFNLKTDPAETKDVSAQQPEVMKRLMRIALKGRWELGDTLTGSKGREVRPPGKVEATPAL
jgi:arylsulfatase A